MSLKQIFGIDENELLKKVIAASENNLSEIEIIEEGGAKVTLRIPPKIDPSYITGLGD